MLHTKCLILNLYRKWGRAVCKYIVLANFLIETEVDILLLLNFVPKFNNLHTISSVSENPFKHSLMSAGQIFISHKANFIRTSVSKNWVNGRTYV